MDGPIYGSKYVWLGLKMPSNANVGLNNNHSDRDEYWLHVYCVYIFGDYLVQHYIRGHFGRASPSARLP